MSEKYNGPDSFAVSLEPKAHQPLADFLQSLKRQDVSTSTLKAYSTDLRGFFAHLHLEPGSLDVSTLEKLQPQHIESYLKSLAEKPLRFSTIKRTAAAIRRFFSFLVEQKIITEDPAKSLVVKPGANSALTPEQVASLFDYLVRHQKGGSETDIIRYRRDELILLLMILYGVRQYQLSGLKLSQLQKTANEVSLLIKKGLTIKLDAIVLPKLRDYLSIRNSNADLIFLEPFRKKPVDHSIMRAVLTELTYAIRVQCSPRSLYDTYLYLQQNPEERHKLLTRISL